MEDFDKILLNDSVELLKRLIATPSFSREEGAAARVMRDFLDQCGISWQSRLHNTWCYNRGFDAGKPTILLNSHIDTVRPSQGWAGDPFTPTMEGDRITGLGSNDAGGPLVSLLAAFRHFNGRNDLPFNLCFAATAEEEISGENGIAALADVTSACAFGIVGEPTGSEAALSERGLMVLDGTVTGRTGHAARDEGINALYLAVDDINWFRNFRFEKADPLLGEIKMTVTMIEAGTQHNVVPDICRYVADVRTVAAYTHEEIVEIIQAHTRADIRPRSMRLRPSHLADDHLLARAVRREGIPVFASTTLSDQALLAIPTLKMGPGQSARSHTPGEFIHIHELDGGIRAYIRVLNAVFELAGNQAL